MNFFNKTQPDNNTLKILLNIDYIQDDSQVKWLVVFIFEILCNIFGIIFSILIQKGHKLNSSNKDMVFFMILLLIDSFADIFSYYNIKEKYQSTIYILYNHEYLINSKYFDYNWGKTCFQRFDQMKNQTEFILFNSENKEIIVPEDYFPICFD